MTTLRHDGYLEIGAEPRNDSDAVLAACFLGKGYYPTMFDGSRCLAIQMLLLLTADGVLPYVDFKFPYFIPASTVAEVWRALPPDNRYRVLALVLNLTKPYINAWLRKHTQETP